MIKLRDYQEEALKKVQFILSTKKDVVLAASPSSGKTVMALEFIKRNSGTFLILTHGQTILKQMWEKEINLLLPEEKHRITYGLPQGLRNKDIPVVDYVIVDEAHEFTFAKMVQDILKKNSKAKKLYLTGTPAKFIAERYDVVIIPAIQLIDQGFISDLYVGLFSTNAQIKWEDRNESDDVVEGAYKKLEKTVETDLDSLLESMVKRLKSSGLTKDNAYLSKATEWAPVIGKLNKTMIACASVKQADKVLKYFKKKNINAISSNSVNDPDSENIQKFQDDNSINILIVVDRAILGFNMPNLVNVVDMTCSHNINRIYQLYARVMRLNEEVNKKYFFKLTVDDEMQVTKFYMEASLCLMYEYFISKYNGKNLNTLEIPVKVDTRKAREETTDTKKKNPKPRVLTVDDDLFQTVSAAKLMTDIFNKTGQGFNEYAMVSFKNIKREVWGDEFAIDYSTTETLWKDLVIMGIANEKAV